MTSENKKILTEHIAKLAKFFQENGMDINPFPKVVLSEDNDPEDILDKTGHYSPGDNQITLYCNGRAGKDVLRTCSHEFVHAAQDRRGDLTPEKLGESSSYTKGSKHLKKMEVEAYVQGNILLRRYTESLQK